MVQVCCNCKNDKFIQEDHKGSCYSSVDSFRHKIIEHNADISSFYYTCDKWEGMHLSGDCLWRRISTDEYYLISREYGGYFIYGTQNKDRLFELILYINNYVSMEIVMGFSARQPVYTFRQEGLHVVKASKEVFEKIENKHWFSDIKQKGDNLCNGLRLQKRTRRQLRSGRESGIIMDIHGRKKRFVILR